jgi:hypothetical protein
VPSDSAVVEDGGVRQERGRGASLDGPDREAGDVGRPGAGLDEARREAEERGLPGAVGPHQHDELAGADLEVERHQAEAVAVVLAELAGLEDQRRVRRDDGLRVGLGDLGVGAGAGVGEHPGLRAG